MPVCIQIIEHCEVTETFSTYQIIFSLPAAATFNRNILVLCVLPLWMGHKFEFWSTVNFSLLVVPYYPKCFLLCGSKDLLAL